MRAAVADFEYDLLMETTWLYVTQTVPSENWDSLRLGFNLFTQVE